MRRAGLAALAAMALAPAAAAAQDYSGVTGSEIAAPEATSNPPGESPRNFFLEVNGGQSRPAVDSAFGALGVPNDQRPYQSIFGSKRMWFFEAELDWELFQQFGSLSLGLAGGFATVYGHGLLASDPTRKTFSPDGTSLNTIPVRALAVYRFDWAYQKFGIPLIPFGKVGIAETFWWATNGSGSVPSFNGGHASGGKSGYELAAGIAFALNWLDPTLARDLDRDSGINGAYLTAQYVKLTADNFGKPGLNLSSHFWLFGIGLEF